MATEVSNIDELLLGGGTPSTPQAPESRYEESEETTPDVSYEEPEETREPEEPREPDDQKETRSLKDESYDEEPEAKKEPEYDDYGNTKTPSKTYTEEEVNERINKAIRERLARGNNQNQQQPTQQQVAQQAQGFDYNPDSEESWEIQLEKFVEKTVSKIGQKQAQQQQQERDQAHQAEFEDKFTRGMSRFSDFREVVASQPVTDPMTYALRGLTDPAAFIYAASKRHPTELARISQIADPAVQIMEMGRLEERMRKSAPGTKAPRPVSKSRDDASMPSPQKKKEPSIEDLIAKADAKKKALFNQKRGGR
jgi:hypothetical protein